MKDGEVIGRRAGMGKVRKEWEGLRMGGKGNGRERNGRERNGKERKGKERLGY